jgi:hypothetical protein
LACPLSRRSGKAPDERNVLGTPMLVGHTRHVHITALCRAMVLIDETARTLRPLQAAACTYRIAFGPRASEKVPTMQGVMPSQRELKQNIDSLA